MTYGSAISVHWRDNPCARGKKIKTNKHSCDFYESGSPNLFSCGIFASAEEKKKKVAQDKMHTLTSGAGT